MFSHFVFQRRTLDVKWTAPSAEGSFSDARGDIIISHDFISVNSASAAFDLYMKAQTSSEEFCAPKVIPFTVGKIEFDLNMHEFEFFRLVTTYTLDFPRPLLLKASGRVKFQGKLLEKGSSDCLVGEVSISGLKLNQLLLAPQLSGLLRVSPECIKVENKTRSS